MKTKTTTTRRMLTELEMETLEAVKDGADIWGYTAARTLRTIEREFPGLVDIVRAMEAPEDGAARQPYFGAILTAKGYAILKEAHR